MSGEKSLKNMILLSKAQVAKGTPATLTPAENAQLVRGFSPSPIKGSFVPRNNIVGYKGNQGSLMTGVFRQFEFEQELAGSGTAGTAPKWAPNLLGCDFSQTLSVGVSAAYAPIKLGPYLTMVGHRDDIVWTMVNAKGTVTFEFNSGQIPVAKYRFIGEYSEATTATFPTTADYDGFVQPLTVSKLNTPTLEIYALMLATQSLNFDFGNELVWRDLIQGGGAISSDRQGKCNVVLEEQSVGTIDWAEIARLGTEGALNLVHGTEEGNIIEVDAPRLSVAQEPGASEDNKIAMSSIGFDMKPVTGNDEILITVR